MLMRGFQIKPFAVLCSSFQEVLWMDSDCVPIMDPTVLWHTHEYQSHGCLFWSDLSRDPHWIDAHFWRQYGIDMVPGDREFEAGQVLLDKRRVWDALQVTVLVNAHYTHFYRRMYGDKDTWRFAFKLLGKRYGVVAHAPDILGRFDPSGHFCGNTMVHKTPGGEPVFLHRTLQSLPRYPTPLPRGAVIDQGAYITEQVLVSAANARRMWVNVTRGGMQYLQTRLDSSAPGWRVDMLEADGEGHTHWCVYVDGDENVRLQTADAAMARLEEDLARYLTDLARLGVVDTLLPGRLD
jgi:hypothetical protein